MESAITGVSLTLKSADLAKTTTVTVSKDTAKTKSAIEGFVKSYNSMMTTIKDLTGYNADTKKAGIMQGDSLPRSIQSQVRGILSSTFDTGSGSVDTLANFGIKTTREGLLEIDSKKLTDSIENSNAEITTLFSAEKSGLATKMSELVDSYVKTGGIMDSRDTNLDEQLSRIKDSRVQLNLRMSAYNDRLLKQFNAMDAVVGSLNAQSSNLQQRLDSLPGVVRKK